MKTIAKTLAAISILMISLNVIAGTNPLSNGQVHYKVQIHLQKDVPFHTTNVYIVMLDGKDRPKGSFMVNFPMTSMNSNR